MRSRERHHWGFRKLRPPGARVCVADSEFERQTAARHSLLRSGLRGWDSNADSRLQRRLCSPAYTTPEGRPTKYRVADSGRQKALAPARLRSTRSLPARDSARGDAAGRGAHVFGLDPVSDEPGPRGPAAAHDGTKAPRLEDPLPGRADLR